MAVAVRVAAVSSVVCKEGSPTLKFGMIGLNTSINDIRASSRAGSAIIGVGSATTVLVRDAGKPPCGTGLGGVGPLLNLAKAGFDNGILLDVINLKP
jgi:hypothetical protein